MTKKCYHRLLIFKITLVAIFILSGNLKAQRSRGVVAYPYPITVNQNDGTKLKLYIKGDAVLNWYETDSGEKVIKLKDGRFVYAKIDSLGNMVGSDQNIIQKKSFFNRLFSSSNKIKKENIFYSKSQINKKEERYFRNKEKQTDNIQRVNSTTTKSHKFPTTGKRKMLTILAEFSDTPHSISHNDIWRMMNQKGYNGIGSFKDYFTEISYGHLEVITNVTLWVKVPHTKAYYGANDSYGEDINPHEFIQDAVKAAMKLGITFSEYDNDKDGYVDFLQVIHSGVGEECGEDSDAIWSHQWNLNGYIETNDGTKISGYFTAPELFSSLPNTQSNIGVICHEFAHALGLPDYYDTDYAGSGGFADGLGNWDLMDSGCWNDEGRTPAHTNAYSKFLLGWINLKELNKSSEVNIKEIINNEDAYIIKTNKEDEFFILENRQKIQFDKHIPHHGLLVYHVNRASDGWLNNKININPDKEAFKLLRSKSYSKKCPFPGSENITYLTDSSSPSNLLGYNSNYSHKALINIKEEDQIIKFIYYNDNRLSHELELTVFDKNDPIYNAQINLIRTDYSTAPFEARYTNEEGSVIFNKIIKGAYYITVSKNGYKAIEKKINIYENRKINTVLEKQHNLTINITSNNKPIENAEVEIICNTNNDLKLNNQITNKDGNVIFEDICIGTYTISIDKYNFKRFSESYDINTEKEINIDIKAFELKDILKKKIKLYPNPSDGEITLEVELSNEAIIMLIDNRGAKVYEKKYQGGVLHNLNFKNISSGLYHLIIIDKNTKLSKRLIIN